MNVVEAVYKKTLGIMDGGSMVELVVWAGLLLVGMTVFFFVSLVGMGVSEYRIVGSVVGSVVVVGSLLGVVWLKGDEPLTVYRS